MQITIIIPYFHDKVNDINKLNKTRFGKIAIFCLYSEMDTFNKTIKANYVFLYYMDIDTL